MSDPVKLIQSETFPKGGKVHFARYYRTVSERTGALIREGWILACNGQALGSGHYGYDLRDGTTAEITCGRCAAKFTPERNHETAYASAAE